jgi:hypothetical protein
MDALTGTVEDGVVRLERPGAWPDGQRVLVIALPPEAASDADVPPLELLEEDAQELARRSDVARKVNREEVP